MNKIIDLNKANILNNIINDEIEKFLNEDWDSSHKYTRKNQYAAPNISQFFDKSNINVLINFIDKWSDYQSNAYNRNSDSLFIALYHRLPDRFKNWLKPSPNILKNAYRGTYPSELYDNNKVIAFSEDGINVASMFGDYYFPFSTLKSYDGLTSSAKMVGFLNKKTNRNLLY